MMLHDLTVLSEAGFSLPSIHRITNDVQHSELRHLLNERRFLVISRVSLGNRLKAICRGINDTSYISPLAKTVNEHINDYKKAQRQAETAIKKIARGIPDCVLFNSIADVKDGWVTAAEVYATLGDTNRFHSIAAIWKYCGLDVVEGRAAGRAGRNGRMKLALFQLVESLIKNRRNKWRSFYDETVTYEQSVHPERHPSCETPKAHCHHRAKRKIAKRILKLYRGHKRTVTHEVAASDSGGQAKAVNHEHVAAGNFDRDQKNGVPQCIPVAVNFIQGDA